MSSRRCARAVSGGERVIRVIWSRGTKKPARRVSGHTRMGHSSCAHGRGCLRFRTCRSARCGVWLSRPLFRNPQFAHAGYESMDSPVCCWGVIPSERVEQGNGNCFPAFVVCDFVAEKKVEGIFAGNGRHTFRSCDLSQPSPAGRACAGAHAARAGPVAVPRKANPTSAPFSAACSSHGASSQSRCAFHIRGRRDSRGSPAKSHRTARAARP